MRRHVILPRRRWSHIAIAHRDRDRKTPVRHSALVGFGPPLDTPTMAGRNTRSPIVQPLWTTLVTVPEGSDFVRRFKYRLMEIGIELLALRLQLLYAVAGQRGAQVARGQFHAVDQALQALRRPPARASSGRLSSARDRLSTTFSMSRANALTRVGPGVR